MDYGIMIDRFNVDLSNADWDANNAEAKAFYDEHRHFPTKKENPILRKWAVQWWIITYLKNTELHQIKAEMLMAIGFKYKGKK